MLSGYGDGGDEPDKALEIVPGAIGDAERALAAAPETRMRFDRVAELVDGFETAFGLELLSTVHWVAKHEAARTEEQLVSRTYEWNERKRRFTPEQIRTAWSTLDAQGWL